MSFGGYHNREAAPSATEAPSHVQVAPILAPSPAHLDVRFERVPCSDELLLAVLWRVPSVQRNEEKSS